MQITSISHSFSSQLVRSSIIEKYATASTTSVSLAYLVNLGNRKSLRESAVFLQQELPKRLARRVKAIQNLPFIVGVNPDINTVYQLYSKSFDVILNTQPISDTNSIQLFSETLENLTESHKDVVSLLASGFRECGKYMEKNDRHSFLDAENHLAVNDEDSTPDWAGVVHKRFSPKILITQIANYCKDLCSLNYGSAPDFTINGDLDATFPYVPVHVDYIMMELLKNSFRATVEHSGKINRHNHPKVEITIAKDIDNVSIRVRDGGGGIPSKDLPFVFDYSFTTVPKIDNDDHFSNMSKMSMVNSSGGVMAGLGFGLPMSRVYASYFGGSLELQTIAGYGCDLFVNLPAISDASI